MNRLYALVMAGAVTVAFTVPGKAGADVFTTLDHPGGANGTYAAGADGSRVVGYYVDGNGVNHGFLHDGFSFSDLDVPGAVETSANGIDGSIVVGTYTADGSHYHGFLYDGASWTTLDYPGVLFTQVLDIDGSNIVGAYAPDGIHYHGFLYDGTTFTSLDRQGSFATVATGIDGSNIVGFFVGSTGVHGFLFDGQTWTTLDYPGASMTQVTGIDGSNIVGSYSIGETTHGFLYDGVTWSTFDYPGAAHTNAGGISGDAIVGDYEAADGHHYGFLAAPETTITVAIDVKPGNDRNSMNPGSHGVTAVVILGSENFDATTVDPGTVSLGGAAVRQAGRKGNVLCHGEDVNHDGFADLLCHVETNQIMTDAGRSVVVLEAETYDGKKIRGEDTVTIVP